MKKSKIKKKIFVKMKEKEEPGNVIKNRR